MEKSFFRPTARSCKARNGRVPRGREAKKIRIKLLRFLESLVRKTGDHRRAEAARQRFPALAALWENGAVYRFMKRSPQERQLGHSPRAIGEYGDEPPRKSSVAWKRDNRQRFSRVSPACEISARRYRPAAPRNARERLGHPRERGGNRRGRST